MTLQLVNEYTSHNLGDAAIYETLAQLAGPGGIRSRLAEQDRAFARGLLPVDSQARPSSWVSVGGDIFNNGRPGLVTRRFLANLRDLACCAPGATFLFGQSIPPSCRGLSLAMLAAVLRRLSSVTVRDSSSHAQLRARGVAAELSFDLAFAYQPHAGARGAGQALFERAGVRAERAVLMSVRGFDAMYPHDNRLFVTRMATLALRLRQRGHEPAVLIHARAGGTDSDAEVVCRLRESVPDLPVLDPFALGGPHQPVDALVGALAMARAVAAVRYHTAVLRLLAGRGACSLHYSNKGEDLAQRLHLPAEALAGLDPERAVHAIERSAEQSHDPQAQRRDVAERFKLALRLAQEEGALPSCRASGAA